MNMSDVCLCVFQPLAGSQGLPSVSAARRERSLAVVQFERTLPAGLMQPVFNVCTDRGNT